MAIQKISTLEIGRDLEKEYSGLDPNTSITYFFIRLGQELNEKLEEIDDSKFISILSSILGRAGLDGARQVQPEWQGIAFFNFNTTCNNERDREEELNEKVRRLLIQELHKLLNTCTSEIRLV